MKNLRCRTLLICIGIWIVTLSVLFLALLGTALIPNEAIRLKMEQSAASYIEKEAFSFGRGGKWNSITDNYADVILLNVAWNMGRGEAFEAVIDTKYHDGDSLGENYGLYISVTDDAEPNTDYTRYWHGSAAAVRFLHLFTDADGMKTVGLVIVVILAVGVALWLILQKHYDIALMLLIAFFAVGAHNVRLSLEYQPSFIIAFALSLLYLALEKKNDLFLIGLSVCGGACVCFFDFLTTETLTILLPLTLVTAVRAKEKRLGGFRENIILYLKCGGAWGLSYLGAFLAKWSLASAVTGENAFINAISSVAQRFGGEVNGVDAVIPKSIFSSVTANLSALFGAGVRVDYLRTWLILAAVLFAIFSVWYLFRGKGENAVAARLLVCLAAVAPIRFLILNNHSFMHNFFTYRALMSTVLAILLAAWLTMRLPGRKRGGK